MSKELLAIAEALANEREIPQDSVFEALEAALAAATRKRFVDEEIAAKVVINQKTGDYITYRQWQIVDDDDFLENPSAQMRESVAAHEFPNANLKVGDIHNVLIENEPFGRISAQLAKQVIIQKIREAEREKIYQQFISLEGTLIYGIVRRHERGNIIVDVNGIEGTILRENIIPRETIRVGDRIRGYLEKVNRELRGPILSISRTSPKFLIELFKLEVPEIGAGNIEIMGAARDAGLRAKIAVRAFDPRVDPVGACVGIRGSRVQGVINELAGERIDIVLWDEDPEEYICKAMAPARVLQTRTNFERKAIELIVADEKLPQAVGRGGQNVRLASQLTGWTISVIGEKESQKHAQAEQSRCFAQLKKALHIDDEVLSKLVAAGFDSMEKISEAEASELASLELNITVETLIENAADFLLAQSFETQDGESETLLINLEGIDHAVISALQSQGITTQEDLAGLSVDELMNYTRLNKSEAFALILKAREPWFKS